MDTSYIVMLVAAFLCAALIVYALGKGVAAFFERYEREWELAQRRNESRPAALVAMVKQVLLTEAMKLQSIRKIHEKLQVDVVRADAGETADEYLTDTLWQGLLVFIVGALLCLIMFGPTSLLIPLVLALAWVWFVRPSSVNGDGEKRSRAIYRRIPYALDLAVLVLQAGGTLREALEIASVGDDPFAIELRRALKEVDSGATEGAALQHMSQRIGLESLDSIVMAIVRGQQTGAPMAHTLSTQAELFRERRLQELEKAAVEAPTKMTFPNMLVMVSVLIIILGPVLVKIASSGLV